MIRLNDESDLGSNTHMENIMFNKNSLFTVLTDKKFLVWQKGQPIKGYDASVWRHDDNGNVIRFDEYGNRLSEYGWEFDHYPTPASLGGSDAVSNLRPLHWKSNAKHGGYLSGLLGRR